jgi:putative phosphoesterase
MLIAIIADTHLPRGRRRLPPACLELLAGSDLIVHAGDVMTVGALSEIEAIGPPIAAVHGNVDCAELRRRLPATLELDLDGVRLAVVHDAGPRRERLERLRLRFPEADAVVFGHSHLPLHERDDGFQIFNPGSPTERRRAPRRTMGTARIERGSVRFAHVELD